MGRHPLADRCQLGAAVGLQAASSASGCKTRPASAETIDMACRPRENHEWPHTSFSSFLALRKRRLFCVAPILTPRREKHARSHCPEALNPRQARLSSNLRMRARCHVRQHVVPARPARATTPGAATHAPPAALWSSYHSILLRAALRWDWEPHATYEIRGSLPSCCWVASAARRRAAALVGGRSLVIQ